jgi:hypothetical protein
VPRPLSRARARGPSLATLLMSAVVVAACADSPGRDGPVAPDGLEVAANHWSNGDPVWTPGNYIGEDQPNPVVAVLTGAADTVIVTANGQVQCSPGTYGTVIGYDESGTEVGQAPFALVFPEDCSPPSQPDDMAGLARAYLPVPSNTVVRSIRITPLSPFSFQTIDYLGNWYTARLYFYYGVTLTLRHADLSVDCTPGGLVRGDTVTCTMKMSDNSPFTPTYLKSTRTDGTVIVEADITPGQMTSFPWRGPALVSTQIEVHAQAGGKLDTATTAFTVGARVGQRKGWMDPSFSDSGFPVTRPGPHWATGAPLAVPYPGFRTPGNGYGAGQGWLGDTRWEYPNANFDEVGEGPNALMAYVVNPLWTTKDGHKPGIHIAQSLNPTDPFYHRQTGPFPYFCTTAHMDTIRTTVVGHETLQWNNARAALLPIKAADSLDALVAFPDEDRAPLVQKLRRVQIAYRDSSNASIARTHAQSNDYYPACDMRP